MIWSQIILALLSAIVVSVISLIGALIFGFGLEKAKKFLIFAVSFSAGALLGSAFFHLLPEMTATISNQAKLSLLLIGGIAVFFILEKYVHWHHCHEPNCQSAPHHLAVMNLVGDGLHNFLDGLIIASSYLISLPLGLTTTLAIIFHEIPQEISDFGVLLHSGLSKARAIFYNLVSAMLAMLGVIIGLVIGGRLEHFNVYVLPLAFSGFLYIAMADLIPELHKETKISKSILQLLSFLAGILIMYLLTGLE